MTRNRWREDPNAVREAERFVRFVGEYVISFQWIEVKIDEIFLLLGGYEKRQQTFVWLARQTNERKIDAFRDAIFSGQYFSQFPEVDWKPHVQSVVDRLHGERKRRNGILHAQFLFDFLAIGAPVVRTHVRREQGDVIFDSEDLSPERCSQIMDDLDSLGFDLGMVFLHLVRVYRYPADSSEVPGLE